MFSYDSQMFAWLALKCLTEKLSLLSDVNFFTLQRHKIGYVERNKRKRKKKEKKKNKEVKS